MITPPYTLTHTLTHTLTPTRTLTPLRIITLTPTLSPALNHKAMLTPGPNPIVPIGRCLNATGRPIVFDLCAHGCYDIIDGIDQKHNASCWQQW